MNTNLVSSETELNVKLQRIQGLLTESDLDALWLRQTCNFAWATCGASSYINRADSIGVASLLITRQDRFVLTNNIEAVRLMKEQELQRQGWEFRVAPWYENGGELTKLIAGKKLGVDIFSPNAMDVSAQLTSLRAQLTPEEAERFRELGRLCALAMQEAVFAVGRGMTEYQIAAALSQAVESKGVQAIVNLIGTDERIFSYRHPLPTPKPLQKYAMLVLCGRKWGLVCSLTRLIHFGALPDDLRRKATAVARIDAEMIAATRPGKTLGDVFSKAQEAYASTGFSNEWKLHHQGGPAGYMPREITATPSSTQPILLGQAYAWNPSITGVKSEDTILVGEQDNEVITQMKDWPVMEVEVEGRRMKRPAILERKQS